MPATTPNRGYPYPLAADPVDVPGDIQRLAEAIDTDVCALTEDIPLRPAVRFRATEAVAAVTDPPIIPNEQLTFDLVDFDTGLPYRISTGTQPISNRVFWIVRPQIPGFYWIQGTVAVPRSTGSSKVAVSVLILDSFGVRQAQNTRHLQASASDGIRTQSVSTGLEMNGTTDGVQLGFSSRTAAGGFDQYTVTERTLSLMLMSPTYP